MIKKLTISWVGRKTKDKDGKTLMGKNGKPYEKVSIKALEYGDEFIGGFGGEWNKDWKEGDQVTLDITESEWNGKKYKNFARVNMTDHLMAMFNNLNSRVELLEKERADRIRGYEIPESVKEQPNFSPDEPPVDEIPDSAFDNY